MIDEHQVLDQVKNGNTDAFAGIIECYQVPIQRYLYRLTGNYETAQDLAQDTFLQAYKSLLNNNTVHELKAWLYRIATNNALQYRRKKMLSFNLFNQLRKAEIPEDGNSPGRVFESIAVNEAFLKVPQEQRVCLELYYVEGFKYREIGQIIGISEDAVRMRVARGGEKFRKAYSPKGGE